MVLTRADAAPTELGAKLAVGDPLGIVGWGGQMIFHLHSKTRARARKKRYRGVPWLAIR